MLTLLVLLPVLLAKIQIRNGLFYDQTDRQIRFRGPNVVSYWHPYHPDFYDFNPRTSFSEFDLQMCRKWGLNAMRLAVMWAGVEPSNRGYNETYLQEMVSLVNRAASYGIYTLIEFHQDELSEKYCGDGIPTWVIDELGLYRSFPKPVVNEHYEANYSQPPRYSDCKKINSFTNYIKSYDVSRAWGELVAPGTKLNTKFASYWKKVASYFKGNPNVLGYQLINEPYAGKLFQRPWRFLPTYVDFVVFQRFYDHLATEIRSVDPDTPIAFEPLLYDDGYPAGFTHPPGGDKFQNLSILAFHFYTKNLNTVNTKTADAKRLGIPSILSEFTDYRVYDLAEKDLQSWMIWNFKDFEYPIPTHSRGGYPQLGKVFNPDGTENLGYICQNSRPWIPRVAGQLQRSYFNSSSKHFSASYWADSNGSSLLYLNRTCHYPQGPTITAQPQELTEVTEVEDGYYTIHFKGNQQRMVLLTID